MYLEKGECLKDELRPQKSFGSNIHDLLAHSFFMSEDGYMGEFAKSKIEEVIDFLKNNKSNLSKTNCKKIIEMIDEPMIKNKLLEMYYKKFSKEFSKELEIKQLRELAKKHNFIIEEK